MISVVSLLYKIDQKLNKLASNFHQSISIEDKTLALNEAQIKLIKQKIGLNNSYRLGLDSFKKRYQDLEKFIEDYKNHPLDIKLIDDRLNKWSASVADIKPDYMFYIDSYIIADKEDCKNRIIYVNNDLTKHADVTILINNSNYKPSFEYQETFQTLSSDNLEYYTDGTFTPTKVYLSYLRYPKYIHLDDFELPNGEILSGTQDSELEEYLEDELVDLTVKDLASYIENQAAIQNSQMRIAENE